MRSVWFVQVQCVIWRKTAVMRLAHHRWAALKCPGLSCIRGNIETSLMFSFILIGSLILPTRKKERRPFYPDCLPQFPGEESTKLDFTQILSIEASPLLEASLIGFPYKSQTRELGFSNVFLCVFVRLTVWKTNDQFKWDGGGSRQSQSVQMLPLAGYFRCSGIHCSL